MAEASSSLRRKLILLKSLARRRGVWFKALNRVDRALAYLAIKVVNEVRSSKLAEALQAVITKLEKAVISRVTQATLWVGIPLARKLSSIAEKLGHHSAELWSSDLTFARYLAVMHINGFGGKSSEA